MTQKTLILPPQIKSGATTRQSAPRKTQKRTPAKPTKTVISSSRKTTTSQKPRQTRRARTKRGGDDEEEDEENQEGYDDGESYDDNDSGGDSGEYEEEQPRVSGKWSDDRGGVQWAWAAVPSVHVRKDRGSSPQELKTGLGSAALRAELEQIADNLGENLNDYLTEHLPERSRNVYVSCDVEWKSKCFIASVYVNANLNAAQQKSIQSAVLHGLNKAPCIEGEMPVSGSPRFTHWQLWITSVTPRVHDGYVVRTPGQK